MSATVSYKHNDPEFEVETVNLTTPLMGDKKNLKPSLATPEIDEQDDDREVVNKPHPGVDDGFFDNEKPVDSEVITRNNDPKKEPGAMPEVPNNSIPDHQNPDKTEAPTDESDGATSHRRHSGSFPHFPRESDYAGHHHEVDIATILEDIPDINVYQHKKTLAQGMMDLALFSANANQLRYVLDSFDRHPYYYPSLIFITLSLILQVSSPCF